MSHATLFGILTTLSKVDVPQRTQRNLVTTLLLTPKDLAVRCELSGFARNHFISLTDVLYPHCPASVKWKLALFPADEPLDKGDLVLFRTYRAVQPGVEQSGEDLFVPRAGREPHPLQVITRERYPYVP